MKKSVIFILSVFVIMQSCSSGRKKSNDCQNQVTFQLNWTNDPTFTGEYLAFEKFWFLNDLKVTMKQGGIGIDPIAMIVAGTADYAVVGADKALMAIADDKPIKIISVDLQRNPVGWIARPELKVNSFDDMKNRNNIIVGDKAGTEISAILSLIIKRKGLNIKPQSVSFDFGYFISNKDCIYPVYLNEEPVRARILNDLNVIEIDPQKEENGGIKLYGNVIICHRDKLDNCKSQVDNIIDGLVKGWKFASENPEETVQIVNKYVNQDVDYVQEAIKRTVNYATHLYGYEVPPGHMEIAIWQTTYNTLNEAGLLSKEFDLKNAIYIK